MNFLYLSIAILILSIFIIVKLMDRIKRLQLQLKVTERFKKAMAEELNVDKKILMAKKEELENLNQLLKKNIHKQTLLTQNIIHELKNKFGEIFFQLHFLSKGKITYKDAVKQTDFIKKDFEDILRWTRDYNVDEYKTKSYFKFNKIISDIQKIYPLLAFKMTIRNHNKRLFLYADEKLLFIVFHNFIKNSINVIREDIEIDIYAKETDKYYEFEMTDNGPGFPADIINQSNKQEESSNIHLGLYLSRYLIENSGGYLILSNREDGQGAKIVFTIKKYF